MNTHPRLLDQLFASETQGSRQVYRILHSRYSFVSVSPWSITSSLDHSLWSITSLLDRSLFDSIAEHWLCPLHDPCRPYQRSKLQVRALQRARSRRNANARIRKQGEMEECFTKLEIELGNVRKDLVMVCKLSIPIRVANMRAALAILYKKVRLETMTTDERTKMESVCRPRQDSSFPPQPHHANVDRRNANCSLQPCPGSKSSHTTETS